LADSFGFAYTIVDRLLITLTWIEVFSVISLHGLSIPGNRELSNEVWISVADRYDIFQGKVRLQ